MRPVKVTFANGDTLVTQITGTKDEVRAYYLGRTFNIGQGENDNLQRVVSVEFLEPLKPAAELALPLLVKKVKKS